MLADLWRTLRDVYFKPISEKDLRIFDFIFENYLSTSTELCTKYPIYASKESKMAINILLSSDYEQIFGQDFPELSKTNFTNLLKTYYLSILLYLPLLCGDSKVHTNCKLKHVQTNKECLLGYCNFIKKKKLPKNSTEAEFATFLEQEEKQLDRLIKKTNKALERTTPKGQQEIEASITLAVEEIEELNRENRVKVKK